MQARSNPCRDVQSAHDGGDCRESLHPAAQAAEPAGTWHGILRPHTGADHGPDIAAGKNKAEELENVEEMI